MGSYSTSAAADFSSVFLFSFFRVNIVTLLLFRLELCVRTLYSLKAIGICWHCPRLPLLLTFFWTFSTVFSHPILFLFFFFSLSSQTHTHTHTHTHSNAVGCCFAPNSISFGFLLVFHLFFFFDRYCIPLVPSSSSSFRRHRITLTTSIGWLGKKEKKQEQKKKKEEEVMADAHV